MARHIPRHRILLIAYTVTMLIAMITLMAMADALTASRSLLVWVLVLIPVLVIVWSIVEIEPRARILGYWGLAILMIPLSVLGIFGGWGLLYAMGVIFLLATAWAENEGER